MRIRRALPVLLLVCLTASSSFAGSRLSIRLVHATNQRQGSTRGLEDVAHVLKRSLPFNHFRLVSSRGTGLPASGVQSLDGYAVQCQGPQNALKINVSRGGRRMVNTSVSLRDGTPFVLGGLPSRDGKLILVFVAR